MLQWCKLFAVISQVAALWMLTGAHALSQQPPPGQYQALAQQLDELVNKGLMPGSVTYIVKNGELQFHHVNGYQDISSQTPISDDTLFRWYSMSKPITSVAIMMLQDAGKLSVDDPLEKYLPQFKGLRVYQSGEVDNMQTVAPERAVTIGDLLAHKSGITYHFTGTTPVHQHYRKYGVKRDTPVGSLPTDGAPAKNLQQLSARLAKAPLLHQPGERFTYSYSTTVLGYVIEQVSGMPLDRFLHQQLFQPLGMQHTGFFVTGPALDHFVTNYVMTDSGLQAIETRQNTDYKDKNRLLDGGGALAGTGADYLKFATMLANGGVYQGQRFLSEAALKEMFSAHITIDNFGNQEPIGFGYGFAIGSPETQSQGFMPDQTYGWAGSGNTLFWVNPVTHDVMVFMTQVITPPPYDKTAPFRQILLNATKE